MRFYSIVSHLCQQNKIDMNLTVYVLLKFVTFHSVLVCSLFLHKNCAFYVAPKKVEKMGWERGPVWQKWDYFSIIKTNSWKTTFAVMIKCSSLETIPNSMLNEDKSDKLPKIDRASPYNKLFSFNLWKEYLPFFWSTTYQLTITPLALFRKSKDMC